MLHRLLPTVALVLFLTAALAGPVAAQDQPPVSPSVQVVPVTVDVAVPVDGRTVTASVPLSAEVSVRVQFVEAAASAAQPFPVVTLEDAALLLPVLSEMPTGFTQSGEPSQSNSNEDIAAQYDDPGAFLKYLEEEVGRQGGVYVEFTNSQFAPFAGGNSYIAASVLVMADGDGAELYLTSAMERELERTDAAEAVYRIAAPTLGDNSILYKVDVTENNSQYSEYSLWMRAGNAIVIFDARAPRNMGNVDQLLALARTVLARGLEQPAQDGPVAMTRDAAPADGGAEDEEADKPDAAEASGDESEGEAEGSLWDLPHYSGGPTDVLDIGGFKVQVNSIGLLDFAQARAFNPADKQFYDNPAFQGATVFGVLGMTMTNGSDGDLRLSINDAVLVIGSEQVQLSDFQHLGDNSFGDMLLPGVQRDNTIIFALTETSFAELGPSVDVRVQMDGPITEGYDQIVPDAKFRVSLTLTPTP